MIELSASHLVVRRHERTILNDVNLRAGSGEFIAIVGANGAGKSTLLSALAGLLVTDEGDICLDGKSLATYSSTELSRRRAYLPQNPRCEWPISVERLVALGLTPSLPALGSLSRDYREKIDLALADCGIAPLRDRQATTLSGGEQARAMLARAFVGEPDILVVDEPVTGLDPRFALDAVRRLRAYAQSGKLVIASLHDLTLAARYASRVIALREGKIEGDGLPAAVLTTSLISGVFEAENAVLTGPGGLYIDFIAV
jgi:iron complex transport system ATP-binding protein